MTDGPEHPNCRSQIQESDDLPLKKGDEVLARWEGTYLEHNQQPEKPGEFSIHDDCQLYAILPNGAHYVARFFPPGQNFEADPDHLPLTFPEPIEVRSPRPGGSWRGYLIESEWIEIGAPAGLGPPTRHKDGREI